MSITIESNANEIIADIGRMTREVTNRMASVIESSAVDMRDEWRANARVTAGKHGKHYPNSIQYRMTGAFEAIIAPDESQTQGAMSFEFGSRNQPPHLDGQRALDYLAPLITRRIESQLVF